MKIALCSPMIEMPENSDMADFELMMSDKNQEFAEFHIRKGSNTEVLGLPMLIFSLGLRDKSLVYVEEGVVKYWCLYSVHEIRGLSILTQKAVWTDTSLGMRGFARRVLLEYFLNRFTVIETSEIQRPRGARMWETLVHECLEGSKAFVYAFLDGHIEKVESKKQFHALRDRIWGNLPFYKQAKIFLSLRTLSDKDIE